MFVHECAEYLKMPLLTLQSKYKNVENVARQFRYINGVAGAKCTEILKRRPRKEWEHQNSDKVLCYIWGYDLN